ncbi:MAG: hypothetical protein CMK09_03515 [Ponticaulis sp.]|nr:hypothetical protein [Ponticaulis sp.]
MTSAVPLKAKQYRPLVDFLTETIDQSFDRELKFTQAIKSNHVSDHGQLDQIRMRRDAAYKALERVLEFILNDIRNRTPATSDSVSSSTDPFLSEEIIDRVFDGDDLLKDLRAKYEASLVEFGA